MAEFIDLHLHTIYSDGTDTPEELVELARQKQLAAFAITDHDNVGGYREARECLRDGDPELVSGVELSAGQSGEDIHILGYFIDPNSTALQKSLANLQQKRNLRGDEMFKKLQALGIAIPQGLIREIAGNSAVARPHVADALVRVGAVRNYDEAFRRYIGIGCDAYVAKENLKPKEAIALIHQAGGLAFLAHPAIGNTIKYVDEFVTYGLDGIEVYHSKHNKHTRKGFISIAQSKSLLVSGGTDYHGRGGRYGMIGSQPVPLDYLVAMKKRLTEANG
ncbi:MAG: PHP domain-containing protein [candidate division Zixibacteria bacterium]|nr:PHP domain-containing protein [candidate division Zixibacteria bacterium]